LPSAYIRRDAVGVLLNVERAVGAFLDANLPQRQSGGPLQHRPGRRVEDGPVTGALELRSGEPDGAALVGAAGVEGDETSA
jgi:hypothetical protein